MHTEWVQVLSHRSVMEKKIARWQKWFMVLNMHESGAAAAGGEEVRECVRESE